MDYYQILGVNRDSSEQEIKAAYRKLAMQHHPDKGGDATKFHEINEAYDTLSNPQKRAAYDSPSPQFDGNNFHFDFGDMFPPGFEHMFRQGGPFDGMFSFQRRAPTNQNIQLSTSISLEDAFHGKEIIANVTLPSGREQTINIKIPKGIHEGATLRLAGMGDDSLPNAPRGDIMLTIHVNAHPTFHRQGDDLIREFEINCIDAILGKTITVETLDGRTLQTEIPAGIQSDSIISLPGQGMPNFNMPDRRGRLLLKLKVKIPQLSEDQKNILRSLNI